MQKSISISRRINNTINLFYQENHKVKSAIYLWTT